MQCTRWPHTEDTNLEVCAFPHVLRPMPKEEQLAGKGASAFRELHAPSTPVWENTVVVTMQARGWDGLAV